MLETMEEKRPCAGWSLTPELEAEAVALARQTGRTAGAVANEIDPTETTVREWVMRAKRDEGVRADGLTG